MITLTENAIQHLKEISDGEGIGHYTVRVGCKGGGCVGLTYDMFFDDQVKEDDEEFEQDGIKIVVDAMSFQYLDGTSIDYLDGLMESGFRFSNPNSKGSCGCGHSFYT